MLRKNDLKMKEEKNDCSVRVKYNIILYIYVFELRMEVKYVQAICCTRRPPLF